MRREREEKAAGVESMKNAKRKAQRSLREILGWANARQLAGNGSGGGSGGGGGGGGGGSGRGGSGGVGGVKRGGIE